MGLMINFFYEEYKTNKAKFFKKILNSSLKYLSIRQLVGLNKNQIKNKKIY